MRVITPFLLLFAASCQWLSGPPNHIVFDLQAFEVYSPVDAPISWLHFKGPGVSVSYKLKVGSDGLSRINLIKPDKRYSVSCNRGCSVTHDSLSIEFEASTSYVVWNNSRGDNASGMVLLYTDSSRKVVKCESHNLNWPKPK